MNNSYYKLIFSDLPLSVSVAFSFDVRGFNPSCYKSLCHTIESNFSTSFSKLISFYQITEYEFERNLIKLDFRTK